MKNNKKKVIAMMAIVVLAILLVNRCAYSITCYHAINAIESLSMPDDIEIVNTPKAWVSDVNYSHVRAEMIIRCEQGEEYVSDYVTLHNSEWKMRHIEIWNVGGMSDMAIYDFECLPKEEQEKILADGMDKYINITYERRIIWAPVSWYLADGVEK